MRPYQSNKMYLVTEDGKVYSLYTDKFLKQSISKRGYYTLNLVCPDTGERSTTTVHRMVASCYLEPDSDKWWVNHKDGNKLNNHVENLEWTTDLLNKQHATDCGLMVRGSDHHNSKLDEHDVEVICSMFETGFTTGQVLKAYPEVSRGTMLNIRGRRTWKHISCKYTWNKCEYKRNKVTCRDYRKDE